MVSNAGPSARPLFRRSAAPARGRAGAPDRRRRGASRLLLALAIVDGGSPFHPRVAKGEPSRRGCCGEQGRSSGSARVNRFRLASDSTASFESMAARGEPETARHFQSGRRSRSCFPASNVDIDLSSLEFWARPYEERERAFRWLRDNDPVSWHRPPEPLRNITQAAFSPRNIRRMEQQIDAMARQIVDEVAPLGSGDLCELVFKQLPGRVFAEVFVGLKDMHRREVLIDGAEQLGAWADPRYAHIGPPLAVFQDAAQRIMAIAHEEAARCRREPDENLMSWIVQAQHEGQHMTEAELGAFFTLLVGAANDTSRHAMAHAVLNLQHHPDEKARLLEDFEGRIDGAVEELLRWSPPLMHFRRTAVEDFDLEGVTIKAGDKVVLWYCSGNRDERAFPEPDRFDILRSPNRNLR